MSGNTSKFSLVIAPLDLQCEVADEFSNSPLISYDSVTKDLNRLAKIKNFTMFNTDMANNKLPQWMAITPNMSLLPSDLSLSLQIYS